MEIQVKKLQTLVKGQIKLLDDTRGPGAFSSA